MVNDFIDGITKALYEEFGDEYKYYVEDVEQNLKKPCFTVGAQNPTIRSTSPLRYNLSIPIIIHYFSNEKTTSNLKKDCYDIGMRLSMALEYITVSDCLFRGENIEFEIVENVLQFFITYKTILTKEQTNIFMESGTFNGSPIKKE